MNLINTQLIIDLDNKSYELSCKCFSRNSRLKIDNIFSENMYDIIFKLNSKINNEISNV